MKVTHAFTLSACRKLDPYRCVTKKTDVCNVVKISQHGSPSHKPGDTSQAGILSEQNCEVFYNEPLLNKTAEEAGWQVAHVDQEGLYPFRVTDSQNSVIGRPAILTTKTINNSLKVFDEHIILGG